jgi:hypothetical protein
MTTPLAPSSSSITTVAAPTTTKLAPRATTNSGALAARVKPKAISEKVAAKPLKAAPKWTTTVIVHDDEINALTKRRNSPTGKLLLSEARKALKAIKAVAPQSSKPHHKRVPGYLKRNIVAYLGEDSDGLYSEIATRARANDGDRAYYGRIQNQKGRNQKYLERGLRSVGG